MLAYRVVSTTFPLALCRLVLSRFNSHRSLSCTLPGHHHCLQGVYCKNARNTKNNWHLYILYNYNGKMIFKPVKHFNPCPAEWINLSHPLVTVIQLESLLLILQQIKELNRKQYRSWLMVSSEAIRSGSTQFARQDNSWFSKTKIKLHAVIQFVIIFYCYLKNISSFQ